MRSENTKNVYIQLVIKLDEAANYLHFFYIFPLPLLQWVMQKIKQHL